MKIKICIKLFSFLLAQTIFTGLASAQENKQAPATTEKAKAKPDFVFFSSRRPRSA